MESIDTVEEMQRELAERGNLPNYSDERVTIYWNAKGVGDPELVVFDGSVSEALSICQDAPERLTHLQEEWEKRPEFDFSAFDFGFRPGGDDPWSRDEGEVVRIEFDGDESRYWRVLRDSHGNYEVDTNVTDFSFRSDDRANNYDADTDFSDDDEDEDEEYVYRPLSLRGLIRFLDGQHAPISPVDLGIDGPYLTDGANTKIRYESSRYPQLQAFMVARARHWLQHHEWVVASDIPVDVARIFGRFDFAYQPETYWAEGAVYIEENDLADEESQPDEVEIAEVGIVYDDQSGVRILVTAYRDPDYVEIADEDIEDDEEGSPDRETILYRSVTRDDNGYWTGYLSHSSTEPLAFWEFIDILDGSGIETELDSIDYSEETGTGVSASWTFSSHVYPELEAFINLRSSLAYEYDTWIRLEEILTAVGQNSSTPA